MSDTGFSINSGSDTVELLELPGEDAFGLEPHQIADLVCGSVGFLQELGGGDDAFFDDDPPQGVAVPFLHDPGKLPLA